MAFRIVERASTDRENTFDVTVDWFGQTRGPLLVEP